MTTNDVHILFKPTDCKVPEGEPSPTVAQTKSQEHDDPEQTARVNSAHLP